MTNQAGEWQIYRTRFLIRARQLSEPLTFVDALGREHRGQTGDYLVESSDGLRRIAPREIFEDVYIAMGPARGRRLSLERRKPSPKASLQKQDTSESVIPLSSASEAACAKRSLNPAS